MSGTQKRDANAGTADASEGTDRPHGPPAANCPPTATLARHRHIHPATPPEPQTPNSAHGPPRDLLRDHQHPSRPIPHRPRPHPFPICRHLLRLNRRPQKRPPIQRPPRKLLKTQHARRIHTLHMRPRARPSPPLRRPHQLRPHRIQLHIPQKRLKPQVTQQLRIEPRRPVRRPRAQVARPPQGVHYDYTGCDGNTWKDWPDGRRTPRK